MERNFYGKRLFPCWVMASQESFKDDVGGAALLDAMNTAVARAHFKEVSWRTVVASPASSTATAAAASAFTPAPFDLHSDHPSWNKTRDCNTRQQNTQAEKVWRNIKLPPWPPPGPPARPSSLLDASLCLPLFVATVPIHVMAGAEGTTVLGLEVPGPDYGALRARPVARVRFSPHGSGEGTRETIFWKQVWLRQRWMTCGCPSALPGVVGGGR